MKNSWYSFDVPISWLLLAIMVAVGLALALYTSKKVPWNRKQSLWLGAIRMVAIFLILLLLLEPMIRQLVNQVDAPTIILAMDNSESVKLRDANAEVGDIQDWYQSCRESLGSKYKLSYRDFSGTDVDTIHFDFKTTDLRTLLRDLEIAHEGENVAAVLLVSDGIVTSGELPQYASYRHPIFTLGLGDTIAPRDLLIHEVRNNKNVYQGNQFPVRVRLYQKGYDGTTVELKIREGSEVLDKQTVKLQRIETTAEFILNAEAAGLRHLTVEVSKLDAESSFQNNRKDVYINVIEGKDKVLILAPAPHPDIAAIRKVLNETENYETDLFVPGLKTNFDKQKKYDVVIEHHAFSGARYPQVRPQGTWYILGKKSLSRLNKDFGKLNVKQKRGQWDQVVPAYNENFTKFRIASKHQEVFREFSPVSVPFGDYQLSGAYEVLFWQQVGSLTTKKPLMAFFDDGTSKAALTVGSGLWQWKLQEAGINGQSEAFDEIILKTIQYLSIKTNREQFIAKPRKAVFNQGSRVLIDLEVYNEIYERVFNNGITLKLTDERGETKTHEFTDSELNSTMDLGRLSQGVYKYEASTMTGGKLKRKYGQFSVREIQLEGLNLTADHELLRQISEKTGGQFFPFSERETLIQMLKNAEFKDVIRTEEEVFPLINGFWVLLLIAMLLSLEWFLRKYLGAY